MKNIINKNTIHISAFSVVFYIVSIFITFDTYCKNQVTPETPLYNIAGLPFLRMDFILILFTAAFLIGSLVSILLKKGIKILLPLSLGVLGCIALFISLFDVNTMQIIDPTMRISHVIMTVSRVLAIVAGASGIFAGIAVMAVFNNLSSKKPILISSVSAIILSVVANAENMQTVLYFVCAVLLLISSLAVDFSKSSDLEILKPKISKRSLAEFISVLSITVLFGISYSVLRENAGISETGFTAISGLILLLLLITLGDKQSNVINGLALLFGSVVSYICIHYASDVITYSGNRVVYVMPYSIGIACIAIIIVTILYKLIINHKQKSN